MKNVKYLFLIVGLQFLALGFGEHFFPDLEPSTVFDSWGRCKGPLIPFIVGITSLVMFLLINRLQSSAKSDSKSAQLEKNDSEDIER